MGCYRLTYDYEPTLFLEEQGEKIYTVGWQVWKNENVSSSGVDDKVLNSAGGHFQDGIPTADELRELFKDSFIKEFYDPLKANIGKGGYTAQDIINYAQNFNYDDLKPTKGSFGLAPVQGSRFAVTDPGGAFVEDFDLFQHNTPNYFGYMGKVTNPGVGLIEVTTPSGYLIQFVVNLEVRLKF
ncbi:MAG: hypothetical protein ACKO96_28635 [Flammeovirgaceae bacterium]